MKNPAAVNQPKLKSPIGARKGKKGNSPYLKFRRKLRRNMF